MGIVRLLNASRCGRIHCYFTSPFFIVGAVTSLGYGLGLLPFGPPGVEMDWWHNNYWRHRAHLHSRTLSRQLLAKRSKLCL